ncbi:hypothetical protein L3Y34_006230 [Caenorhabditis briggsae]|nr:hypothetical protein L3Y34_006230 [Caenorhabditis briggsae]
MIVLLISIFITSFAFAEKDCSIADSFQAISCRLRASEFAGTFDKLDESDSEKMSEFRRSCKSNNNCIDEIGHCIQDEQATKGLNAIQSFCSIMNFLSTEMTDCDEQWDQEESECYASWNPFQNDKDLREGNDVEGVCGQFFGRNNCLKQEIVDTCGSRDWQKFKNYFLELNDAVKQCDFYGTI